jgi:hypothetical protein
MLTLYAVILRSLRPRGFVLVRICHDLRRDWTPKLRPATTALQRNRGGLVVKVLVVGAGGREHALCWALAASPVVSELLCAPGSDAIAREARCVPLAIDDLDGIVALCRAERVELVVPGPELPLVLGLVDRLEGAGIKACGPGAAAARLEGSKAFTKAFCARHGIPTARHRTFEHDRAAAALGPQTLMPAALRRSAKPSTSGSSGPGTTRSTASSRQKPTMPSRSSTASGTHVASWPIASLPGAQYSSLTRGEAASDQQSACSRPPEPTTRTFMRPPAPPLAHAPQRPAGAAPTLGRPRPAKHGISVRVCASATRSDRR